MAFFIQNEDSEKEIQKNVMKMSLREGLGTIQVIKKTLQNEFENCNF